MSGYPNNMYLGSFLFSPVHPTVLLMHFYHHLYEVLRNTL